jgi:phosphoglycolate phosphatase
MHAPHDVLVFDLDGTISDPVVGIGRSINHALARHGYEERPLDALAVHIGPPLDEAFHTLTGRADAPHIASLVAAYRDRYGEVGYVENTLYPGARETLRALRDAGVTMGLCTSKRVDFAERILALFELRDCFAFVDGGEIGQQKWMQVEGLVARGLAGPASVMIGDRAVDLVAAHRNGLSGAGVLWGHGSREELEAHRPRYLLEVPEEWAALAGIEDAGR